MKITKGVVERGHARDAQQCPVKIKERGSLRKRQMRQTEGLLYFSGRTALVQEGGLRQKELWRRLLFAQKPLVQKAAEN